MVLHMWRRRSEELALVAYLNACSGDAGVASYWASLADDEGGGTGGGGGGTGGGGGGGGGVKRARFVCPSDSNCLM